MHLQAEEQLSTGKAVASDADLTEQETLPESYRSACKIRLARWWYRQQVAEVAAGYKEGDKAGEVMFGETEEKDKDITDATPRRHNHEAGTSADAAHSEEE